MKCECGNKQNLQSRVINQKVVTKCKDCWLKEDKQGKNDPGFSNTGYKCGGKW